MECDGDYAVSAAVVRLWLMSLLPCLAGLSGELTGGLFGGPFGDLFGGLFAALFGELFGELIWLPNRQLNLTVAAFGYHIHKSFAQ